MKNHFLISDEEKNRIRNLHESQLQSFGTGNVIKEQLNKRILGEQTGRNESKSEGWNKLIWENKRNPKSYDEAYNCFNDNGIPYSGRREKIVYNSCFDVDGKKFMPDSPPCIEIINQLSIRNELNDDIIECLLSK